MRFLNILGVVVMVTFWYPALASDQCTENQTSYQHVELRETYKVVMTKERQIVVMESKQCFFVKNFFSWVFSLDNECETRTFAVYKQVYRAEKVLDRRQVVVCCPGYTMNWATNSSVSSTTDSGTESVMNSSAICEKSKCDPGKYGEDCTQNCTCGNQTLYCDEDGQCICPSGRNGTDCTEECDSEHYGQNCKFECQCINNSTCDNTHGTCNCTTPGWKGDFCDQGCDNVTFGLYCSENCTCNENQTCDSLDGTCTCKPGWMGSNCTEECEEGTYGIGCNNNCTCFNETTQSCDRTNGFCTCKPGYRGIDCGHVCKIGTFGKECAYNCSGECEAPKMCHFIDGRCGCLGSRGDNCSEPCEHGKFWFNCSLDCLCNETNSNGCNSSTGDCYCLQKWKGRTCDEVDMNYIQKEAKRNASSSALTQTDFILIVAVSSLVILVCSVAGFVAICRQKSAARESNGEEGEDGAFINASYDKCSKKRKSGLLVAEEHEMDGYQSPNQTSDCANDENDTGMTNPETVVYEDADVEVDNVEGISKDKSVISHNEDAPDDVAVYEDADLDPVLNKDGEDDYDITATTCKGHRGFEEDEVLYETAEAEEAKDNEAQHNYNTFEEVRKTRLNSLVNELDIGNEEDYNVLEHFPIHSKKSSIKDNELYSSFAMLKSNSVQEDDDEDYDSLHHTTSPKPRMVPSLDQYHHIDLTNNTVDGEKISLGDDKPGHISQPLKSQRSMETVEEATNVMADDNQLPKGLEVSVKEKVLDSEKSAGKVQIDIQEDIYDECIPDENVVKTLNETEKPAVEPKLQNMKDTTEIVYESCSEDVPETITEVVYETVSDDESVNTNTDKDVNKKDDTSSKKSRRRRSEDYEEFQI